MNIKSKILGASALLVAAVPALVVISCGRNESKVDDSYRIIESEIDTHEHTHDGVVHKEKIFEFLLEQKSGTAKRKIEYYQANSIYKLIKDKMIAEISKSNKIDEIHIEIEAKEDLLNKSEFVLKNDDNFWKDNGSDEFIGKLIKLTGQISQISKDAHKGHNH